MVSYNASQINAMSNENLNTVIKNYCNGIAPKRLGCPLNKSRKFKQDWLRQRLGLDDVVTADEGEYFTTGTLDLDAYLENLKKRFG